MSTDLTREQACDKFIADNQFRMVAPSTKMQSADSFRAGWSARDAEVERLRDALALQTEKLTKGTAELRRYVEGNGFTWCDDESTVFNVTTAIGLMGGTIDELRTQLQAALKQTEPTP